jgi:quinol monooxygenase YgiN
MAVAIIQEWRDAGPGTENYDAISEKLRAEGNREPDGLLIHTAGFDGDTFRIFEVWESEAQFEAFVRETLVPAIQAAADENATQPEQRSYELHGLYSGRA